MHVRSCLSSFSIYGPDLSFRQWPTNKIISVNAGSDLNDLNICLFLQLMFTLHPARNSEKRGYIIQEEQ